MVYKRDYLFEQIGGAGSPPRMDALIKQTLMFKLRNAIGESNENIQKHMSKYSKLVDEVSAYLSNNPDSQIDALLQALRGRIKIAVETAIPIEPFPRSPPSPPSDPSYGVPITDLF